MNAVTPEGELAERVLDEYMRDFQHRNPKLRVFSAQLHMDEATPHLHIDFVPFVTGSKRGLDTRVSLKQALAVQGFKGGTRADTEWNQWVQAEKEQLAAVMLQHGIEWEQKGTHEKHKSVLEHEKKMRAAEVELLEAEIAEKQSDVETLSTKLEGLAEQQNLIELNTSKYDDEPEWQLPEPKPLMSAKSYHEKIAVPFVKRLKNVIRSILAQFFEQTRGLQAQLNRVNNQVWNLNDQLKRLEPEVKRLRGVERNFGRLRRVLGDERVYELLGEAKESESAKKLSRNDRDHTR